jgi:hypothetical protein
MRAGRMRTINAKREIVYQRGAIKRTAGEVNRNATNSHLQSTESAMFRSRFA